ncbi:PepSY-like domain-containing protein [Porphyromonas cangingivalis]|uniref:PepSY-like domain-containing protein n=1 Tax=Porphyromonas cangingivalis TaxID=36874 RepID=UPI0009DC948D|nr:PepSY-like domain-containing protein [Porphyromonas cangingivalis]
MKMKMILIGLILVMATIFGCKDTDDQVIQPSKLPAAAQSFIETNFPGAQFVLVTVDKDFAETTYDVVLNNGVKLEFDAKGEWKEVEARPSEVPANIIPNQIRTYVTEHYPETKIVKINRDPNDYEVDLSNGVELKFNSNTFAIIDIDTKSQAYVAETEANVNSLPGAAKAFIAQHFEGRTIVSVRVDRDDRRISYDVILSDGAKLEFDQAGEWKEVNTRTYAVPAAIIPVQIHDFVTARYPSVFIIKIDRDRTDYEIDLSNGVKVKFDLNFNVIKIENDRNGNNDNNQPGAGQLPANAQAFIAQHFGHLSIVNVKVDRDDRRISYDVILSDGTKLEFDQAGEWKEVNTRTYAVPAAIIPAPIRQQVSDRYPYAMIIKIDRDSRDYEVKLSNGVELKFDRYNYRLIKIENDNDRDDDQVVGYRDLPAAAKSFIAEHFANVKVVKVEKDRDDGKITYEVRLSDGAELEFRQNGDWKEVNTRTYPVPTAIVPTQITQQIANRFPGAKILKISRSHKKYEVKLSNGLEVSFNPRTFVITEIDD